MTDEQFQQLMKKLEEMERQMKAGTWWPTPPAYPPQPTYIPSYPHPMYPADPRFWPTTIPQITD